MRSQRACFHQQLHIPPTTEVVVSFVGRNLLHQKGPCFILFWLNTTSFVAGRRNLTHDSIKIAWISFLFLLSEPWGHQEGSGQEKALSGQQV